MSLQVIGLREMLKRWSTFPVNNKKMQREKMTAISEHVKWVMVGESPVKSGDLVSNTKANTASINKVMTSTIGPNMKATPYAWFQHEGTSRGISPNPFVDRTRQIVNPYLRKEFSLVLDKALLFLAKD